MRTGDMRSEKGVQYSRDLLKHRLFLSDTGIVKCTYLNRTSFMNFPSVGRGLDIYIYKDCIIYYPCKQSDLYLVYGCAGA